MADEQARPAMGVRDTSDDDVPKQPESKLFNQQAFGPWSNLDPKTKQGVVRTNVSGGSTRNSFAGTYPPAPTIAQGKTAISGGYEFTINLVTGRAVAGYNVYSSLINNAAVSKLVRYLPQPRVDSNFNSIQFQEITTTNPFYWVASVNSAGKESLKIPAAGAPAPTPLATSGRPSGGGSGFGSSGGGGKSGIGQRYGL